MKSGNIVMIGMGAHSMVNGAPGANRGSQNNLSGSNLLALAEANRSI